MKGLQLLLESLGIKIERAQIEDAFSKGKDALPKLVSEAQVLNARLDRMERNQLDINDKLGLLLSRTSGEVTPDPLHEDALSTVSSHALTHALCNGSPGLVTRDA